eukprot:symbB.v1.2.017424.t1/scaffold1359.1/size123592/9
MAELKVGHEILTLGRVVRPSPISMAGPLLPFEAFKLSVGHFFQKKKVFPGVLTTVLRLSADLRAAAPSVKGLRGNLHVAANAVLNGELEAEACIFNVKPFAFNEATKAWDTAVQEPALFPGLYSKARIYQDRFRILHQRLLLQGEFVTEGLGATSLMPGQRKLTSVASLVGNPGRKLSFGLLRREEDESRGRWVIEDLHKVVQVELVLGETRHLVTDGSFVLCEGELLDGIFRVCELHPLKAIPRQVSIEKDQLPVQIPTATMTEHQLKILEAQESSRDGMYVVHLDSVQVLDMLETLFQGYESAGPPKAYILMGNFCSRSFVPNAQGVRAYREGFERLKFMLRNLEAHVLHGTRFIFIPGPRDPGPQTLPKAPLPNYLTADLARDIPGAVYPQCFQSIVRRQRHWRPLRLIRHAALELLHRCAMPCTEDAAGGIWNLEDPLL